MTAFFLERAGGRMNDIKLAKLQYLAERGAILRFHAPIANDEGVSLEHGPCLSQTLNLTTSYASDPLWERHIALHRRGADGTPENTVELRAPFAWRDYLSPAAIEMLEELWSDFGGMGKWQIKGWCHDRLREYVDVGKRKRRPIRLEDIFIAEGDDESVAAEKAEGIRYHERFVAELARERAAR